MNKTNLYQMFFFLTLVLLSIFIAGCAQRDPINQNITQSGIAQNLSGPSPGTSITPISTYTIPESPSLITTKATQRPARPTPSISSGDTSEKTKIHFIDVHVHLRPLSMNGVVESMDTYGIDRMVNMEEPPDIFFGHGSSIYGIPDLSEQNPDRFISLYSDGAVYMLDIAARTSYTEEDQKKYTSLLENAMKSGKYRGFGEVAIRHTPKESGADITVPANHPWMFIMSDIAARYDVPIDIHMEDPDAMLPGFERLLDYNRNTTIIWDHTGWELSGATPTVWRQLLIRHPNLYGSIKCRPSGSSDSVPLFLEDKTINKEWMELFTEFPGRFMIGSDIKPGHKEGLELIPNHIQVLKSLPPDVRDKIARENAIRIFKIPKNIFDTS
jgi:predicted TIM-barrel fold metal-dependent hydrolase